MSLVHTVLSDIDGGNDFYALWQKFCEGDGGIGHRLVTFHHHIEIATIHLTDVIGV